MNSRVTSICNCHIKEIKTYSWSCLTKLEPKFEYLFCLQVSSNSLQFIITGLFVIYLLYELEFVPFCVLSCVVCLLTKRFYLFSYCTAQKVSHEKNEGQCTQIFNRVLQGIKSQPQFTQIRNSINNITAYIYLYAWVFFLNLWYIVILQDNL